MVMPHIIKDQAGKKHNPGNSFGSVWDCYLIFSEAFFKEEFLLKKDLLQKYNDDKYMKI